MWRGSYGCILIKEREFLNACFIVTIWETVAPPNFIFPNQFKRRSMHIEVDLTKIYIRQKKTLYCYTLNLPERTFE